MGIGEDTRRHVQLLVDTYLDKETDLAEAAVRIRAGSAVVRIRLLDSEPPMVRVFAAMVIGVSWSPELLDVLNEINSTTHLIRLFWKNDAVWVADELLASTLDLEELATGIDLVADVADHYDDQIVERFGGSVALDE